MSGAEYYQEQRGLDIVETCCLDLFTLSTGLSNENASENLLNLAVGTLAVRGKVTAGENLAMCETLPFGELESRLLDRVDWTADVALRSLVLERVNAWVECRPISGVSVRTAMAFLNAVEPLLAERVVASGLLRAARDALRRSREVR